MTPIIMFVREEREQFRLILEVNGHFVATKVTASTVDALGQKIANALIGTFDEVNATTVNVG